MPHRLWQLLVLATAGFVGNMQPGFAESSPVEPAVKETSETPHSLAAAQLSAIRTISQHVLAAKKSGEEDTADAEQVAQLRASLDQLIAVELGPRDKMPLTLQGQESAEQQSAVQKAHERRETARSDVRALSAQLKQRAEVMDGRARASSAAATQTGMTSAGFAIDAQRAQLFTRWAQQLDEALADDDTTQVGKLVELRKRLQMDKRGLTAAPPAHATPTLQAMSSTSETPIRVLDAAEVTPTPEKPSADAKPRKTKTKPKAKTQ